MLRIASLLLLVILFNTSSFSQECDTTVYELVEEMPEFPGGQSAMYDYFSKFSMPSKLEEEPLVFKFYFEFVITCTGEIINVRSIDNQEHSVSKYYVRIIEEMPNWTPGRHKENNVNVKLKIPVNIHWE